MIDYDLTCHNPNAFCNPTTGECEHPDHAAACGHTVTDRQDLHWSDQLEDEVCPDCCEDCNR